MLRRTYESLKRQTDKDFEWLIVDDGSTDNTNEIVAGWLQEEHEFPIRYIWKINEGFHTGYNTAIANMDSELAVCIDSDDYMPDDAVELIHRCWLSKAVTNMQGLLDWIIKQMESLLGAVIPNRWKRLI